MLPLPLQVLEAIAKGRLDYAATLAARGFLPDWYVSHLRTLQQRGPAAADCGSSSAPGADVYGGSAVACGAPDEYSHNARIVKAAICAGGWRVRWLLPAATDVLICLSRWCVRDWVHACHVQGWLCAPQLSPERCLPVTPTLLQASTRASCAWRRPPSTRQWRAARCAWRPTPPPSSSSSAGWAACGCTRPACASRRAATPQVSAVRLGRRQR